MKGKHYFLFASLLGALLLLLAACGGSTSGQTSSTSGETGSSSGQTNNQQTGGPSIVGMWTGNCSLSSSEFKQAEFDADGTLILDNFVAKYEVSGNNVRFISPQTTLQYSYSLSTDGNQLSMSDSSGHSCLMVRSGTNAGQTVAQSLIGVWTGNRCTFQDGSGFSQIEFKSDGTLNYGSSYTEKYTLPDYSHIQITDENSNTFVWSFSISGNTLTMTYSPESLTCSFQKSA